MEFKELVYERQGPVAVITMNTPERLNPFTCLMGEEIVQALYDCEYDPEVRAVIFTGKGRAFSSGGDIRGMSSYSDDRKPVFLKEIIVDLNNTVRALRRLPKPVIAAVNGIASGAGFSLALACDLILAADSARFNLAYVNVAISPDGGATYFLPRLIGAAKTRELVFTGDFLDAATALQMGIINRVVPTDTLLAEALVLGAKLAAGPTYALGMAKELIDRGFNETLEGQLENERVSVARCGGTADFREAVDAFMNKRKPRFQGK